jgi:hypothetical protein
VAAARPEVEEEIAIPEGPLTFLPEPEEPVEGEANAPTETN